MTAKLPVLDAVPALVVTLTGPVTAPSGTMTARLVELAAVTTAVAPPNRATLAARVAPKFVPAIVTEDPTAPLAGTTLLTVGPVGAPDTVNTWLLVAVPPAVLT
jgi:hypothetical protein